MEIPLTNPDAFPTCPFSNLQLKTRQLVKDPLKFEGILQVKSDCGINVVVGHANNPAARQLERAADKYFEKYDRLLCFHLRATEETLSVSIHGFFSNVFGAEQLEFRRVRLHLLMMLFRKDTGIVEEENVINREISIHEPEFELEDGSTNCTGTESMIGTSFEMNKDRTFAILYYLHSRPNDFTLAGTYKVVFLTDLPTIDPLSIVEKIKDRSVNTDFAIIPNDGEDELPCHKHLLAVHSPVLATMITSGMEESGSGKIKMEDMSSDVAKAFLDFIYKRDVEEAMESCKLALELFKAGHKYDIDVLESAMKKIMLAKSNGWFDMNVASQLFLYARNVEGCDDLKVKAAQAIKSKCEGAALGAGSTFDKEFLEKNPSIAMELFLSC